MHQGISSRSISLIVVLTIDLNSLSGADGPIDRLFNNGIKINQNSQAGIATIDRSFREEMSTRSITRMVNGIVDRDTISRIIDTTRDDKSIPAQVISREALLGRRQLAYILISRRWFATIFLPFQGQLIVTVSVDQTLSLCFTQFDHF